jgi:hypothetical protein
LCLKCGRNSQNIRVKKYILDYLEPFNSSCQRGECVASKSKSFSDKNGQKYRTAKKALHRETINQSQIQDKNMTHRPYNLVIEKCRNFPTEKPT